MTSTPELEATDLPAPEPPLSPPESEWGTADPLLLAAASPSGNWVAVCQARRDTDGDGRIHVDLGTQGELGGDRLEGYLVTEPGSGMPIDGFAGHDPTGRWVAVVIGEHLWLLDTFERKRLDLSAFGADPRDDQLSFGSHRATAFDPTGRRMLYIRRTDDGPRVVVRALDTGSESVIDPGDGVLWRADFDASGRWVLMRVVTTDTNKNGKLAWTARPRDGQALRCAAPVAQYTVREFPGDRPTYRVAPAEGGEVLELPDLVVPVGESFVERDDAGRLWLRRPGGKRLLVAKERCEADLVHADPERDLVLFTCRNDHGRADVVLFGPDVRRSLGLEVSAYRSDHWFERPIRLVPVHPGQDAVLVDLDTREVESLETGDEVVATEGTRALVLRGSDVVVHELGGRERTLLGPAADFGRILRAESIVVVPPHVVDLRTGQPLGTTGDTALAVTPDGRLLVPADPGDAGRLPRGPLRWAELEAPFRSPAPAARALPEAKHTEAK